MSALAIFGNLISGYMGYKANQEAAAKALEIGNANADDLVSAAKINASELRRIAKLNGEAVLATANLNAESIWRVGEQIALAHIDAATENLALYSMELDESIYRHKYRSMHMISDQTAAWGASGVQVGVGSPVHVASQTVKELGREQEYMGKVGVATLTKIGQEGIRRGELTWLGAKERGEVLVSTALLQRDLINEEANSRANGMIRDARVNAASLRRGGTLLSMNYQNQATSNLIGGIMGGINAYYS